MKEASGIKWQAEIIRYTSLGADSRGKEFDSDNMISASLGRRLHCAPKKPVPDYWTLVSLVSGLAAANPQYQLLFRGQTHIYHDLGLSHSLLPSLWRGDKHLFDDKVRRLKKYNKKLTKLYSEFDNSDKSIISQFKESPLASWALLQHYEICDTPLLDLTRSLQVACSFAHLNNTGPGYVYILGLPYQTEKKMVSEEEGIVVVSLLGVTPNNARRPLIQDGFLVGPGGFWKLYISKDFGYKLTPIDFRFQRRIVAVFKIETQKTFWRGSGLSAISKNVLLQEHDDEFGVFMNDAIREDDAITESDIIEPWGL